VVIYLFFYRLFLLLYTAGIRIATVQNKKAKMWLRGRKNWPLHLAEQVKSFSPGQPVVWMHCASLGEFEQGRPLLEKLKEHHPQANFIVSFFSPSGYEVRKHYEGAQVVCYLPMDGPSRAKQFLEIVKPTLVLWVKYEYWYYYLTQLNTRQIPLLLVSGIFREAQPFFKWYNGLHQKILRSFTHLFLQNEHSKQLVQQLVPTEKLTVSGDTRFDRVAAVQARFDPIKKIENWLAGADNVMVCGSTWDEDEKELSHYIRLHPEIKFMLAPHNVNAEELSEIQELLPGAVMFSQLQLESHSSHVLIVDTIGLLSRLYYYATVAYVGGGFGAGIHNVLEAAVWGKPVVHGPEYEKFAEAKDLVAAQGSFVAEDALELEKILDQLFKKSDTYNTAAAVCKNYVQQHRGATDSIVHYIQANRLLTKS
jgi:3-deoxy-D-manno-octulosonic-acid transferase